MSELKEFLFKVFLPFTTLILSFVLIAKLLLPPQTFQIFFRISLSLYILILSSYPLIKKQILRNFIEREFPYFITFLASLSTAKLSRSKFFDYVSDAKEYGYLSKLFEKIKDLAINWRLGFAEACKKILKIVPSKTLKDFLDRFSVALEVGEDLENFFEREYNTILDVYEVNYKKSLENIRILGDLVTSVSVSLAFLFVVAVFVPLIIGGNVAFYVFISVFLILLSNVLYILLVRFLVVEDRLLHNEKYKPKEYLQILMSFLSLSIISSLIFILINLRFPQVPLIAKLALSLSPLAYIGLKSKILEGSIRKKEQIFVTFLSELASALSVRASAHIKAVESIIVHDFKDLNKHIENLLKRLKTTLDIEKAYYLFGCEIGSRLIQKMVTIFARATHLGADPIKSSKYVINSVLKVLDLRELRDQMVTSLRGMLFGIYIGFALVLVLGTEIIYLIVKLFESLSELVTTAAMEYLQGIFPTNTGTVEINILRLGVQILLIATAFTYSYILKELDGGIRFSLLIDFVIMLWIGALLSIFVPYFFEKFLFPIK